MNKFYKNTCINEDDDNVISEKDIRDYLEYMCKSYDLRYSHYKNLHYSSSTGVSSSWANPLDSM